MTGSKRASTARARYPKGVPLDNQVSEPVPCMNSPLRVSGVGFLSLALAMGIGRFAFTPMLPFMIRDGLITRAGGAWLATANYAGYLVGALYVGSIRLPSNRQMQLSWLGIAVLTACMATGHSTRLWVLWRFCAGVLSALTLVATSAWVLPQLARERRSWLAGVVYAGVGVGIAGVGIFCLMATRIGGNARSLWIGLGLLAAMLAWSARLLMPRPSLQEATCHPQAESTPARGGALLILCYGVAGFGYILPATFLPIMARSLIADPAIFGLAWPIFGVAAAVSTLAIAYGLPEANRLKLWSLCNIAMAIGAALPTFWLSLTAVIVAALLVGGTFLIITMAGLEVARIRAPRAPTHLLSRMTASFALGQIAAPALVAFMPSQTSATALSLSLRVAALCLVGTAGVLWIMPASGRLYEGNRSFG